jgi:hypothetical protein
MVGAAEVLQRRRERTLQDAVERLPHDSRRAMLKGLGEGPIIAGAYKVGPAKCPGLAAYRHGARTGYTEFAKAWDRYVRGRGVRRARNDDIATLVAMLRAGLPAEPQPIANGNGNGNGAGPYTNGAGPAAGAMNGHAATNGHAVTNGHAPATNGHAPGTNGHAPGTNGSSPTEAPAPGEPTAS